ncbi:hypothetical protein ACOMHN_030538 [Nucella lapillus]
MHAFLKRHYKRGRGRKTGEKAKHEEDSSSSPRQLRQYKDVVSKSMDSLLLVVSSVPLPAHATLDPSRLQNRKRRRTEPRPLPMQLQPQAEPGVKRRHSFDLAVGKTSDDGDDDDEVDYHELSDGCRSVETSPKHASRDSRSDSGGSQDKYRLWRQHHSSLQTSIATSTSLTSERDWTDSDDDHRSYLSVRTNDSAGLLVSEDTEHSEVLSHRLPTPSLLQEYCRPAGDRNKQDVVIRQRQNALMEHPFFLLEIDLQEGRDLVVRDSCGTSDPYVKFKVGGKQVGKSRIIYKNLNPKWEESFIVPIEDVQKPVQVKVFDYDRGLHDDPMGSAEIEVTQLEIGKETDLKLLLSDRGKSEYMGYLLMTCTLLPKTQEDKEQPDYMGYLLMTCTLLPKTQEDKEQYLHRGSVRSPESNPMSTGKKLKMQTWSGVVTIVLVEGIDLVPMDDNGLSDPYVKFRLGSEKHRSKYKSKTLNPRWLEQFDLRIYNDQALQMEITVYDYDVRGRDDFMGRTIVDLSSLESERTHHLDVELEDGAGLLKLLLTVSGTCANDAQSDLSNFTPDSRLQGQLQRKYSFFKLSDVTDVGHLQMKVFKANGLKSADIGGNSDPFCVLELVNARVQTHTEYKTLHPEWNKVFSFKVRDIHSVLEVTIFDEDRDKKVEFLGKVAIPLLRIRSGERRWYALKDKKLNRRTKGAILLELDLIFNHVKAAMRTVNPTEDKFMQVEPKFKINLLKKNIDRVGQLIATFMECGKFLHSCFSWESTPRSATAFLVFLVMVWNFEIYMLPITLVLIFLKNLLIAQVVGAFKREQVEDNYFVEEDEDEDEEKEKEEKKTFKEKLQSLQDVCLQVQQGMDMVASLGERIKNTFNWTVPWLSTLAVVALSSGVIVLYFIPLRWLILAWGINKFTKNLRKPNAISNNELLDFLSRVPSDRQVSQYREFRPEFSPAAGKKKRS